MDIVLLEKALLVVYPERNLEKERISGKTLSFFEEYEIPNQLVNFLEKFSFEQNVRFNNVYFDKVNEMPDNNLYEQNRRCMDARLLIIGSGLNGDFVVLDVENLKVGYVFHDELWEDELVNPRDIHINLNCSIGEFYYYHITVHDFPVDGYEAEEYVEKNKIL
ncbi:hypothetical protein EDM56_02010 [Brevibacillus fluminis]|uniref:SMI1/KNR4 family protein n=1 Tax=Brevibacillus fluminis TaxID=511487 RepID=A0A3M8DWM0_9BACL|nr:hypothetical protein [Brevibacillus fluminis]RNB92492.1 hypothetical protein EDM56_02010 [Brevibacillus fluminis]